MRLVLGNRDSYRVVRFVEAFYNFIAYNLDLLEEADAGTCLYIVEGEKCADAMVQHGLLATTGNTGAQKKMKLSQTDQQYLEKFSDIVLIPDNDTRGADYAKAWPVPVEVLHLTEIWPECPEKGDVADYFARGGDPAKLSVSVDYSNVTKKKSSGCGFLNPSMPSKTKTADHQEPV